MVAAIHVLVVDDCRDSADALALLLKFLGCDVRTAYDGMTAVEEAERFRPELLLLDLGMPVVDGFAVARRIRQSPELSRALLVAHTGYGHYRKRAGEVGFNGYLLKPAGLDCLRQILDWAEKTAAALGPDNGPQATSDWTSFVTPARDSELDFKRVSTAAEMKESMPDWPLRRSPSAGQEQAFLPFPQPIQARSSRNTAGRPPDANDRKRRGHRLSGS